MPDHITVTAPASAANLGAGFDVLGLALDLRLTLTAWPAAAGRVEVDFPEEGSAGARVGERIAREALAAGLRLVGREGLGCRAQVRSQIPPGRGLGASAALRVAGVLAGADLGGGAPAEAVVAEAARLDGHADNVVAAWAGGVTVAAPGDRGPAWIRIAPPESLVAVMAIPETTVSTQRSRAALPATVARTDAVFSLGRAVLFVAALREGRFDLLGEAMQDRLHQPYRLPHLPGAEEALCRARQAGAAGAALSGSGPSLIALCDRRAGVESAVAAALEGALREAGVPGRCRVLAPAPAGTSRTR